MQKTEKLGLNVPEPEDYYDVGDMNENTEIVERELLDTVKSVTFEEGAIIAEKKNGDKEAIPISSNAYIVSDTPPKDTKVLWIDSSSGGVSKYYDTAAETWKPSVPVLSTTPSNVVGAMWIE